MSEEEEEDDPMSESEEEEINLEHTESVFASSIVKFGVPCILLYGATHEKVFVNYAINPHGVETPLFLLAADHLLNGSRSLDPKWILYFTVFAGDADYHAKGKGTAAQDWNGFNAAIDSFSIGEDGIGFAFLLYQDPLVSKLHVRYWNAEPNHHHHFYNFMECFFNRSDDFRTRPDNFVILIEIAKSIEAEAEEDDDDVVFGGGDSELSCLGAVKEVETQWAILLAQV